jgi:hypothetical protein
MGYGMLGVLGGVPCLIVAAVFALLIIVAVAVARRKRKQPGQGTPDDNRRSEARDRVAVVTEQFEARAVGYYATREAERLRLSTEQRAALELQVGRVTERPILTRQMLLDAGVADEFLAQVVEEWMKEKGLLFDGVLGATHSLERGLTGRATARAKELVQKSAQGLRDSRPDA